VEGVIDINVSAAFLAQLYLRANPFAFLPSIHVDDVHLFAKAQCVGAIFLPDFEFGRVFAHVLLDFVAVDDRAKWVFALLN